MSNPTLLDNINQLAQQQGESSEFAQFVAAYFEHTREVQLQGLEAEQLLQVAQRHYLQAQNKPAADVRVDIQPLQQGRGQQALLLTAPDQPFVVATVTMAIRNAGGRIDWVLHPILCCQRDGKGALQNVADHRSADAQGAEESLLYIEFIAAEGLDTQALAAQIQANLNDLVIVVEDYEPMRGAVAQIIDELADAPVEQAERGAAQDFLRWIDERRFTFLGYQKFANEQAQGQGLGLLRQGQQDAQALLPLAAIAEDTEAAPILVVAKGNLRSWIHHAEPMDAIVVKQLDAQGQVVATHCFLGLFSADAYADTPRHIPLLKQKVATVQQQINFRQGSHNAKVLGYILQTFPRDELFQADTDALLTSSLGVLLMRETQSAHVFCRPDRYGRYYSCMVYVSRDRYTAELREQIGQELSTQLNGRVENSTAAFLRGAVVRVHYQIGVDNLQAKLDLGLIERAVQQVARDWRDDFAAHVAGKYSHLTAYAKAFPLDYQQRTEVVDAVYDAGVLAALNAEPVLSLAVTDAEADQVRLKVYGTGQSASLSAILPIFEHFGFTVQAQRPVKLAALGSGQTQWIHEFDASHPQAQLLADQNKADHLATTFSQVRSGRAEDDRLNSLVLTAGLRPREVELVRTVSRYLLQTKLPYSVDYLDSILADHGDIMAQLVALFSQRFDPEQVQDAHVVEDLAQAIQASFDEVANRDADRVLRAFLGVIMAMTRTNFYQLRDTGKPKCYISIKLNPAEVPELPQPRPAFEAFVYSPEVEGVHLRGGQVARGGLRWSDRREDFRTEVLGLLKAQMVKNAVIVPVGAKGGFIVKNAPDNEDRDARRARGIAAYKTFLRGLLDVTDNRNADGQIIHPEQVVRHDDDDAYLVVAADKGTAGFSDIANGLSKDYGYWLDDAFASGGSAGYDHKGMAITARGGWESVKRHFRELGHDTQSEPFSVVGIGDMAGDVFGNGMLLSRQIQLKAAFNHMHIFIDPNPDTEVSFKERERLFNMDRSAWSDYDAKLLSQGGGVYERSAKSIKLSPEAQEALGIEQQQLAPDELIHEILKAPVNLLWNGGVGTYVKATTESHADVGDRANDAVRVNGNQLRCRVAGEGGNLGMTQAGRIEFAQNGGRLNTDAIDNSAGVNSSDLEVNIKIGLGPVEAAGQLKREDRNALLHRMTDEVAQLVLRTNYLQTQQLSVLEAKAEREFDVQTRFMRQLEHEGQLSREVECLPDDETIAERKRSHDGLTRPELAVLLSHAKVALSDAMLASDLPDDAFFESVLLAGFPTEMQENYAQALIQHGLKRELIATFVTNQLVNRLGVTVAHQMAADHSASLADVIRAYVLADAWLGAEALYAEVEALDNQVAAEAQYQMLEHISGLIKHIMRWQLTAADLPEGAIDELTQRYQQPVQDLLAALPDLVIGDYQARWQDTFDQATEFGLEQALATHLASVSVGSGMLSIVALADAHDTDVAEVAKVYFALGNQFSLVWLNNAVRSLAAEDHWMSLAQSNLSEASSQNHQRIVQAILAEQTDVETWCQARVDYVVALQNRMQELQAIDALTFTHISIAVQGLAQLCDG